MTELKYPVPTRRFSVAPRRASAGRATDFSTAAPCPLRLLEKRLVWKTLIARVNRPPVIAASSQCDRIVYGYHNIKYYIYMNACPNRRYRHHSRLTN